MLSNTYLNMVIYFYLSFFLSLAKKTKTNKEVSSALIKKKNFQVIYIHLISENFKL